MKTKEKNSFSIFDFFDPNGNDKLSDLSGMSLLDLVVLIDDMYISYRDNLCYSPDITFGIELEFEKALKDKIEESFNKFSLDSWILKDEINIKDGAEVNSPILVDNASNWKELRRVCLQIQKYGVIGEKCGGHIHIGAQMIGSEINSWLNFLRLWSVYENIIYRFSCGEFLSCRRGISYFAIPMALKFDDLYNLFKKLNFDLQFLLANLCSSRMQAVNFCHIDKQNIDCFNDGNTFEIRCNMGTLNYIIWQNYVNFYLAFVNYCKSNNFNYDIVDKRYKLVCDKFCNLRLYNEVYIEQALELSDMIFDKNIDKFYFLRQYFKSLEVSNDFIKAKRFTKKRF